MRILALSILLSSAAAAQMQVVPGPFTGTESESFETSTSGTFTACISPRVFNNKADLCTPAGTGAHVTGGWSFQCQIGPQDGSRLYGTGSAGNGFCEYTFDNPVSRFGGYFGVNNGTPDGTANFYDAAGAPLGSFTITAPADCSWTWNGWEVLSGNGISKVEIVSNFGLGNYMQMDAMEIDENPALDLIGAPDQVSLSLGGSQVLTMDVGPGFAAKTYQVLGSVTGTTPGITYQGVNVPVNFDPYWNFTFLNPNTPILNGSAGTLNSLGQATTVFTLPPASDPALAGIVVNHAGIVLDLVGATIQLVHATNAYPATLVP